MTTRDLTAADFEATVAEREIVLDEVDTDAEPALLAAARERSA